MPYVEMFDQLFESDRLIDTPWVPGWVSDEGVLFHIFEDPVTMRQCHVVKKYRKNKALKHRGFRAEGDGIRVIIFVHGPVFHIFFRRGEGNCIYAHVQRRPGTFTIPEDTATTNVLIREHELI